MCLDGKTGSNLVNLDGKSNSNNITLLGGSSISVIEYRTLELELIQSHMTQKPMLRISH